MALLYVLQGLTFYPVMGVNDHLKFTYMRAPSSEVQGSRKGTDLKKGSYVLQGISYRSASYEALGAKVSIGACLEIPFCG